MRNLKSIKLAFEALKDPSWDVRGAIVLALGALGATFIEKFKELLEDPDSAVVSAALHALGTFRGGITTQELLAIAQNQELSYPIRDAAVTALDRSGETDLAAPLKALLKEELNAQPDL